MATITLTVVGSTVGTLTTEKELNEVQSNRLMAYLAAEFGTGTDEAGQVFFQRTPQEMVEAYWASIVIGTFNNVLRFEENKAVEQARQSVEAFA